jgi:argininosuccinate lyase
MIKTMTVKKDNMYRAAKGGFMNATDAADWLVKHGVPFRDAHAIIGQLVLYCINNDKSLDELTLDEYKAVSDVFDDSVYDAISLETCVNTRIVDGGPSEEYISKLIKVNDEYLKNLD